MLLVFDYHQKLLETTENRWRYVPALWTLSDTWPSAAHSSGAMNSTEQAQVKTLAELGIKRSGYVPPTPTIPDLTCSCPGTSYDGGTGFNKQPDIVFQLGKGSHAKVSRNQLLTKVVPMDHHRYLFMILLRPCRHDATIIRR